jgi:hypothetical protein
VDQEFSQINSRLGILWRPLKFGLETIPTIILGVPRFTTSESTKGTTNFHERYPKRKHDFKILILVEQMFRDKHESRQEKRLRYCKDQDM